VPYKVRVIGDTVPTAGKIHRRAQAQVAIDAITLEVAKVMRVRAVPVAADALKDRAVEAGSERLTERAMALPASMVRPSGNGTRVSDPASLLAS